MAVFAVINVIHSRGGPQLYVDTVRSCCCPCGDMVGVEGLLRRLNYPTSRRPCAQWAHTVVIFAKDETYFFFRLLLPGCLIVPKQW